MPSGMCVWVKRDKWDIWDCSVICAGLVTQIDLDVYRDTQVENEKKQLF